MPAKTYRVVQLDSPTDFHSLDGSTTLGARLAEPRGFEFQRLLHVYPPHANPNLFSYHDDYNDQLKVHYSEVINDLKNHDNCGILIFKDVNTIGYDSLIVDEFRERIYLGHMLNWSRDYFNWWIENSDVGFQRWVDDHSFVADFGIAMPGHKRGILMNGPGYGIFGHWLIDFLPRIELSKLIRDEADTKLLFGPLKDFMKDLIARSGARAFESLDTCYESHGELIVPTATKFGYGFFEPLNVLAWRSVALGFNQENVDSTFPSAERIFVSRRYWQGGRAIDYHNELETIMASLGFMIIHPQTLSLREQAWIFSRAKVVVGEDGSALHNIIFSPPGTRLGVLMHANRTNLWHAGICHLLGHQIAYAQLPDAEGSTSESLARLANFVRELTGL